MPGVEQAIHILKPYKIMAREWHKQDSVIPIRGVELGGPGIQIIGGPCSVETREQMNAAARGVFDAGCRLMRGGAFKPRTSPYAFQGAGVDGLFKTAAEKYNLPRRRLVRRRPGPEPAGTEGIDGLAKRGRSGYWAKSRTWPVAPRRPVPGRTQHQRPPATLVLPGTSKDYAESSNLIRMSNKTKKSNPRSTATNIPAAPDATACCLATASCSFPAPPIIFPHRRAETGHAGGRSPSSTPCA